MLKRYNGPEVSVADAVTESCSCDAWDDYGITEAAASASARTAANIGALTQLLVDKGLVTEKEVYDTLVKQYEFTQE